MRPTATHVLLVLVLLGGRAGTVDETSVAQSSAAPTAAEPISSLKTTPTPYPNRTASFPAGPKSEPERPGELTAETAAAFAKTYEYRYSYNDLSGPGRTVGMSEHSCHVESAEAAGRSDSTATQHYDYPPWTARYYVDENSLLREEVEAGG